MNIISPKEFINTFYKDIFNLLSEKFTRIGTRRQSVFREEVLRVFRQTDKSIKVFNTLAQVTSLPVEELILLLESSVEVAHKIYMDNTKLQGRTYEILRTKVNENHSQSREFSNTLTKQAGVIKRQERIISQKNEQIKKFSQEAEKTRSELKKAKSGNNKEPDQQKNSNKSKSTSNRRKRENILEIPVLPELPEDDPIFKKARDIFLYDIPKYWSEEDVRTNIGRMGKLLKIQIRGQHKYKTVKVKIALDDQIEKLFKAGKFGICLNNHFIRWYDASLGLKGRQERDQWQTVRDLTDEEMKNIKEVGMNKFLENEFAERSKAAFVKIIKITKNWKMIGYYYNQKDMEKAVEDSCSQGDLQRIWLVRNRKTIYKEEKKKRTTSVSQEKEKRQEETKVISKKNVESESKGPSIIPTNLTSPETPSLLPDRSYRELGNYTSRKESSMHSPKEQTRQRIFETPDEDHVVNMINKWRLSGQVTPKQADNLLRSHELKKDNVATEEVVEIINEHRETEKIKYVQYDPNSSNSNGLRDKLEELQKIFERLDSEMEWKKINSQAIEKVTNSFSPKEKRALEKGSPPSVQSFTRIGERVIDLAEQNDIVKLYTTLNDGFERRLRDENRYQDKKEIGDKRPLLDSPKRSETSGSPSESEAEEEEVKPYVIEPAKKEGSTQASKIPKDTTKKKKKKKGGRK
ncbi:hypothetical protein RhiirA4_507245 [Rhizophagus irregularis]|uniref:Uncharacterized protein n=1 Tax=Rhizophagus irregularis TaxID=588596 RepID=A0A2I1HC67_9GLOM|nr:hypothetical protein RhiirA4_507245 [Rhizophagus irregularis]